MPTIPLSPLFLSIPLSASLCLDGLTEVSVKFHLCNTLLTKYQWSPIFKPFTHKRKKKECIFKSISLSPSRHYPLSIPLCIFLPSLLSPSQTPTDANGKGSQCSAGSRMPRGQGRGGGRGEASDSGTAGMRTRGRQRLWRPRGQAAAAQSAMFALSLAMSSIPRPAARVASDGSLGGCRRSGRVPVASFQARARSLTVALGSGWVGGLVAIDFSGDGGMERCCDAGGGWHPWAGSTQVRDEADREQRG